MSLRRKMIRENGDMRMGKNRKSGRKAEADRRVFDAVDFFSIASDLPKPPHKLGEMELRYHATKGFRWARPS
jgi:hypothetical protein